MEDPAAGQQRPPVDPSHFEPGDIVADRYRVLRFIARGGMGEVYEVEDTALATRVALKALRAHLVSDDAAADRFRREILLARQVTHPNVCRIFDLAYHRAAGGRLPVLTMELLAGMTLAERLRQGGALPPDEALALLRQVAAGLSEAHRRGIVHRDLKSANVILEDGSGAPPRVVVTDFGLARSLSANESHVSLAGTPAYMAPEQIAGGSVGPATDVYALGVMLYECLTGHLAADARGGGAPAAQIRAELGLGPPGVPPAWTRVIERCLSFDAADRYASMDEVLAALAGPAPPPRALLELAPGEHLARHRIVARIAVAAGRAVYRARDPALGRTVLIELYAEAPPVAPARLRRIEGELRALSHPSLPPVLEVGTHEGATFVVIGVPEARSLGERLREGRLLPAAALALAAQLAGALGEAHAHGVALGELPAEQIVLMRDGRPVLLGVAGALLARSTASPLSVAADLAGLARLLVAMLRGGPPPADSAVALDDLPAGLAPIVARCLEEDPARGWQSARDLAFQLEQLAAPRPGRGRLVLPVALLAAVAGAAVAVALIPARRPPAEARSSPEPHIDYRPLTFQRGLVGNARYGADRHTILYSASVDGEPARVFVKRAGSRDARALSEPGFDLLGLSADGELALRRWKGTITVLARMSIDGAAPRDIAEHVWAADFAPTGDLAAVRVLPDPRRRVIEMPLGKPIYTTPAPISALRVAPAGDRVAFVEHPIEGDEAGRIAVVTAAGALTYLTGIWTIVHGVAWRSDGSEVLFYALREGGLGGIYAATMRGEVRRVLSLPFEATLLDAGPDGLLLTLEDVNVRALVRMRGEPRSRNLSWLDYSMVVDISADARQLLICEGAAANSDDYESFLRPTDGGPAIHLGTGFPAALSPDGRWVLAFARDGKRHRAMLLPTGVGDARELARGPITVYAHSLGGFFPDAGKVVFEAKASGGWQIWEQSTEGGDPRPLTPEGFRLVGRVTVTPDGGSLLVRTPSGQRVLLDLTTGQQRPVPGLDESLTPARFTLHGNALLVSRRDGTRLAIDKLDLATGERSPLHDIELEAELWAATTVTPDGETMAYSVRQLHQTLFAISGPGEL